MAGYVRLGELLVQVGAISEQQLQTALEKQKGSGKRLGTILMENHFVTEQQIIEVLQLQLGVEYIELASAKISPEMAQVLTKNLSKKNKVVPIRIAGSDLYLAMSLAIQGAEPGLEAGQRLADCLRKSQYLPPLLVEMTAVGEETGELEHTLEVISDYYDNETDVASARALSLLEPILIVILGIFVLLVLLSVYLPMFGMYDNVGVS